MTALDDVCAEFKSNEVIALIGPNGSGKTTLIKCILGMVFPEKGDIYFDNGNIKKSVDYRRRIGYMPQIGRYPDNMKIKQLVEMMINIRNAKRDAIDDELIKKFDLDRMGDKTMRSLSGGTRQKVSAALAFMFNPDVLILDEPTAGLDPVSSEILKDKIVREKQLGKLILITSHVLSDLDDITTHIMYLQDGTVKLFDTLDNIKSITGEERLNKSISYLMQSGFKQNGVKDLIK